MKMIVSLPTYNRPERLKEFLEYFEKNSVCSELILGFHSHDPKLKEGLELGKKYRCFVNDGSGSVDTYCDIWDRIKDEEFDMLFGGGDDLKLITPEWDKKFILTSREIAKQTGHNIHVLYGDDTIMHEKLCTHPCYTKEYLHAQGYHFMKGYMKHLYWDNAIWSIAYQLRSLYYIKDIITEHNHYLKDEKLMDSTYALTNSQERYQEDGELFCKWQFEKHPDILVKVRNAIQEQLCKK